ncbi:MAG: Amuc_1100 family pilus-like protein [Verrucomicrobiota bacterium]|nr:Amuc_1100 family pilus-like protein [Limisphaera sp.]MDW8381402.1 Amuc_1100 family pilus-like protein [Verrucomicrobiota bacterium]
MDWVKRNLLFVISSAVALILLGLAIFYLYSSLQQKNEVFERLTAQYEELNRLYNLNPNPGNERVNNIQAARDQQAQLRAFLNRTARYFIAPPPIPQVTGTNRVTAELFTPQLWRTLDQLRRTAESVGVQLPPDYSFSFEAQKNLMRFAPGSLDRLAVQLGEIKAICEILFAAKINSLDNLRRERVSSDDYKGPVSDYLEQRSATNELAILTPYEVTFRCFSPELAAVLAGFHSSPYCILVKAVDVEPATLTSPLAPEPGLEDYYRRRYGLPPTGGLPEAEMPTPPAAFPRYAPPPELASDPATVYAQRYGIRPGGGAGPAARYGPQRYAPAEPGLGRPGGGGIPYRPLTPAQPGAATPAYPVPTPGMTPPGAAMPVVPGTTGSQGAGAQGTLQTVLDEKPLRVTMLLHVVKLLSEQTQN